VKYSWRYIHHRPGPYPELYLYQNENSEWLKVEINRLQRVVKLQYDGAESFFSVIKNRHIIREKNLQTGESEDLDEKFRKMRMTISSLPDNEVLEIIGGSYGVLTEFLGKATRREKKNFSSLWDLWKRWLGRVHSFFRVTRKTFQSLFYKPAWYDFLDMGVISVGIWFIFSMNYDILSASFFGIFSAIFTGFVDLILRRRDPYLIKIMIFILPGGYFWYLGYVFQ